QQVYDHVFGPKPAKAATPKAAGAHAAGVNRFRCPPACPFPASPAEQDRWDRFSTAPAEKVVRLWQGDKSDYENNWSQADAALLAFLAILTNGDRARMEQLFGGSALGRRDKWTGREDYRDRTLRLVPDDFVREGTPPAQPPGTNDTATPKAEEPKNAVAVILDFLKAHYRPDFREGNVVHCGDGRRLTVAEA